MSSDSTSRPATPDGPGANRAGEESGAADRLATPLPPPVKETGLGRELGGDLPCVVCGYNLRGLSIRSMCPECGANVRATILSVVDPQAAELRPIHFPRLTATAVVLWAFGGVAVALMSWLPQAADLLRELGVPGVNRPSAALGVVLGLATSALGSVALIRPHRGVSVSHSLMAALATLLYAPLGWALWRYHQMMDHVGGQHYLTRWAPSADASHLLALACVLIAAIITLQRPNARLLVARSMVMRTGRVDRQTLYVMAMAALVMGVGALLGRAAPNPTSVLGEIARGVGVALIAFGAMLLSIGALGSLLDCARIAGAILIPKVTVRQVIREGRPHRRSRFMQVIDPTPPPAGGGAVRLTSSVAQGSMSSPLGAPIVAPERGPAGQGAAP